MACHADERRPVNHVSLQSPLVVDLRDEVQDRGTSGSLAGDDILINCSPERSREANDRVRDREREGSRGIPQAVVVGKRDGVR